MKNSEVEICQSTRPQRYELRCLNAVCHLEPQVLDLLSYLIRHSDRVVTKQELLDHLWLEQVVSDATLHQRLTAAHKAVGDNGRDQHTIQTIRGRGYRFIATVETRDSALPEGTVSHRQSLPSNRLPRFLVERESELDTLHRHFVLAQGGQRQVVFISGEAGIGKTALVETFMSHVEGEPHQWVGHGQCVAQYGAGEAYRPVLEALGRLCRGPNGAPLRSLLEQHAPSWIAQMPSLLPVTARAQRVSGRITQPRMLRELTEALEWLTAERPLVLVLEDLHWSDGSTLEWLAYVARRRDPSRLFVLGTYRPLETLAPEHPLRTMVQELCLHGHGVEVKLNYLSEAGVASYLAHGLAVSTPPTALARALHQRTSGNPLFLVAIVADMIRQHQDVAIGNMIDPQTTDIPESLRQFIAQQIDQLPASDQQLLEAASVAGTTFCLEALAAGLALSADAPMEVLEAQCDALARRGQFLRASGVEEWPDGSLSARYTFIHALYQEVLIDRISPARRIRLHRHIGTRKESGYGRQARDIAAELAVHFQYSRDVERAVPYLHSAAQTALQRGAHHEAILHLRTGLNLLPALSDSPERRQHELAMRTALRPALIATQGYTTAEVERTYAQAHALCESMGETASYFPVLWGLWIYYNNRGSFDTARMLTDQLLHLARRDDALLLQAYHALGNTLFWCGEFHAAQEAMDRAVALYNAERHRDQAFHYGGHDPAVCCLGHGAVALWACGYPDQALQQSQRAVALAQSLSHPSSLVHALSLTTRVHVLRSEWDQVLACAERTIAIATEHGFAQPLAMAKVRRGWLWVMRGQVDEGLDHMHQGGNTIRSIGAANVLPVYLARLAEAYAQAEHVEDALTTVNEALDITTRFGVRNYAAELYRLRGTYHLRLSRESEADCDFRRALETAQRQHAKSWELRAATSLGQLWQRQGRHRAARELLAPVYDGFTEGLDTVDLQQAKALLNA